MKSIYLAAASALVLAGTAYAGNASYPANPVKVIVGFSAGGPTDVVARAFANFASQQAGQSFIVENKPGANSTIAAQYVSQEKPDGYTLLLAATNLTTTPALYGKRIKFDVEKSFAPICAFAKSPTVLVVGPSLPVNSLRDVIARAKKNPGKYSVASPGVGSSGHFAMAKFEEITGTKFNHIPYNGAAPAITALMGGQVDMSFATLGSVLSQLKSGKLKVVAVASAKRLKSLPKVPTFAEEGIKNYSEDAWYGLLAPAGAPPAVLSTLEKYARGFQADAQMRQKLDTLGLQPDATCGANFAAEIKQEVSTYSGVARKLGLKN
ncbi:tripartite tricarboxylate transporter substrate binding protein [Candidimonas humi]|uniref:Bug family tripartite tricarboxylate transporter substrate binding protein n=1 Tax=Candidimonas humi TaxID=683355 RepID=A0ABV8P3L1_9BURK|nr:tripartite tricarboxylate transporter substrate binding protein [Candidimonas humi]MBV6306919.1 tripartite tricarboxylate transporter substrate binding protein [Candidimonas humi]